MSEVETVRYALTPGVTAKPGVHSGVGLSTVRDYARYFGGVMRLLVVGLVWYSGHRGRKRSRCPECEGRSSPSN
jgi:hypothetical protein